MLNINTNDGGLSLAFRNGAGTPKSMRNCAQKYAEKTLEEKMPLMVKMKFKFGREQR